MSRMYLAHHELEGVCVIIVIIILINATIANTINILIVVVIIIIIIIIIIISISIIITCVRAWARSLPMVEVASVACVRRACRAFTCTSAALACWAAPCISSLLRSLSSTCLLSSLWLCSADWSCPCRSWLDWAAESSWAVRLETYMREGTCHSSKWIHMHEVAGT